MTPRTMALAYRIWAYATPKEWDVSYNELAEVFNVHPTTIANIANVKGWAGRIRRASNSGSIDSGFTANGFRRGMVSGEFDTSEWSI